MGWLITGAYVAVWLLYGWRLTIRLLDAQVQESTYAWGSAERAAKEWLGMYLFEGFALALFWPVVAPVRGLYRVISDGGLFRTPTERAEAERKELDELRRLALENGLPLPEFDRRKGAA